MGAEKTMISKMFDLTDRRVLITGSTRGIGRVLLGAFADAGALPIVHGRDAERLECELESLREQYGAQRVAGIAFDLADEQAIDDGIARIDREFGSIDILVNNAGIQHREPLLEVSSDDWDRVLRTNLTSAFLVGRAVARGMVERGRGKIVNILSIQSELARVTIGPYTASKGGLRNLTKAMAAEWAGRGLQVNGVAPGYIRTELTQALIDDERFNTWVLERTPAGRWGEPADIAGAVCWLASDAAAFVNGQTIFVDGGMTAVV
ncbi:glucose 1-dehydrogenase [Microbacterium sp. YJN-G]|uniref:glucose 1-dehydrogenase n=1 Tax=Microbacterium sp. YJN-G TaxID=2763257 RepID=UPI001D0C91C8|nr:glucose 1-dehydrogenase [Microbacterium sp. YJN-G]